MRQILLGSMLSLVLCACGGGATSEVVTLAAQMGSGESGTATLTDNGNNTTTVVIAVSGGSDTGSQAAHIHTGVCGSNGPIYAGLNNVQGGTSTSMVAYTLSSLQGGKYYINVHNSANIANIQSCGNIQ
jgi:hypothetical protein